MGTGLDSQLGCAAETTYGTFVTPTRFLEFDSMGIKRTPNRLTSTALRRRPVPPVARDRETTRHATGPLQMKVPNKGLGRFLNQLHGAVVAPVQADGAAYLQTHPLGVSAPNGKSLTLQFNKPTTEDGDKPFTYLGCVFTNATFSCELNGELELALDVDARDASDAQALAVASYQAEIRSFDFGQAILTIAGDPVEAIVTSFNLSIPLPMKTDRWGLGSGRLKRRPIGFNDYMRPTMTLNAEFTTKDLYDRWVNQEEVPIELSFEGEEIESGYPEKIAFAAPASKITGEDPGIEGPDVLSQSVEIEVYDNGTEAPVEIEYQTVDTTL